MFLNINDDEMLVWILDAGSAASSLVEGLAFCE